MSNRNVSPAWRRYLRFWGPRVDADVEAELRFHFQMRVDEYVSSGMSDADARAAVLRRFGDVEAARSECRAVGHREHRRETRVEQLDTLLQDFRLIARSLLRQRSWTAVVVLTLALGIGANSALFTIINAVLLRPLPYPHSERILSISESDKTGDLGVATNKAYVEWQRAPKSVVAIGATGPTLATIDAGGGGDPESVRGARATASYFSVIGLRAARGRIYTAGEESGDAARVVVISDSLWRGMFGGDSAIVGRIIQLDGIPTSVIGVMPPEFTQSSREQFWTPLHVQPASSSSTFFYEVYARLRNGASIAGARAELTTIERRLDAAKPEDQRGTVATVMTLHDRLYGDSRPGLLLLLGAVVVLLVIACANVSNLLLSRATRRQREFAVRVALGASRWRVIRYLLCESILLSLSGGLLGLTIPIVAIGVFVRSGPGSISKIDGIHVDGAVLAFTFAVSLITGIVFGLVPSFFAGRGSLALALSRGSTRATGSQGQNRIRQLLVVSELGTALVLLTVAALLTRSFARVLAIDPGFQSRQVLAASVRLPYRKYTGKAPEVFFNALMERVRALPGAQSASLADVRPLGGARYSVSKSDKDGKSGPRFDVAAVDAQYFATMGISIVVGRPLTTDDRAGAPRVGVINATMARAMYPGSNPIGQVLRFSGDTSGVTIVGVMKDVPQRTLEGTASPGLFTSLAQGEVSSSMTMLIRTTLAPASLEKPIREIVRALDPTLPSPSYNVMDDVLAKAVAPRRFNFMLLGMLASLAATLAAVGLYGVMTYLVADRTQEIGIRIALGAERRRVVGFVVGHGMTLAFAGILAGLAGSLGAVRLLRTMVYEVNIYDPYSFAAGGVLLAMVAFLACYLPARRAARVDPVVALRAE